MAFPGYCSFVFPDRLHCFRVVCRRAVTQPMFHPGLGSSYLFTSFKVVRLHSRRSMFIYGQVTDSEAVQISCLDCAEFQLSDGYVQTFLLKLRLFIGILASKTCLSSFAAYSCCLQTVRHCNIVTIMLTGQADPLVVTSYLQSCVCLGPLMHFRDRLLAVFIVMLMLTIHAKLRYPCDCDCKSRLSDCVAL